MANDERRTTTFHYLLLSYPDNRLPITSPQFPVPSSQFPVPSSQFPVNENRGRIWECRALSIHELCGRGRRSHCSDSEAFLRL